MLCRSNCMPHYFLARTRCSIFHQHCWKGFIHLCQRVESNEIPADWQTTLIDLKTGFHVIDSHEVNDLRSGVHQCFASEAFSHSRWSHADQLQRECRCRHELILSVNAVIWQSFQGAGICSMSYRTNSLKQNNSACRRRTSIMLLRKDSCRCLLVFLDD